MKRLLPIITLLFAGIFVYAQAPQKFSYQAVVRDANEDLLRNRNINIQISLFSAGSAGNPEFVEQHAVTSNTNGLVTFVIGEGQEVSGSMDNLNWDEGPFFIRIDKDINTDGNYDISGIDELLSVPFALFSQNSATPGPQGPQGPPGPPGADGTSVTILGALDSPSDLPPSGEAGDAWLIDNELWVWTGSSWENVGSIVGPQGPEGNPGPQGPEGPAGPEGPQGPQGPEGPRGPRGFEGPQGATGPPGLTGPEGPQGPQGPIGPQGPQGPEGPQGMEGTQGPQGPQGPEGPPGDEFWEETGIFLDDIKYNPSSNVWVGIGLDAPTETLHVNGGIRSDDRMRVFVDGNSRSQVWSNSADVGLIQTLGINGNRNASLNSLSGYPNHGVISVYDEDQNNLAGMYINAAGEGIVFGDIKNFRMDHPEEEGKEIWYASLEGPEAGAYERGTGTLSKGETFIPYTDHFQWVVNPETVTIVLTPHSTETYGLAVVKKEANGFVVRELMNGKGDFSFDYEVKGVRSGYEDYEVIRDESSARPEAPREEGEEGKKRR